MKTKIKPIGIGMGNKSTAHKWQFKARFRRHAFGWRSQPAIRRVKEAVSEIKKVARKDKVLAAEGAVSFLEKVSPALEHVDSSSGAIGTAVSNAISALVEIIASAPAGRNTREKWLERLIEGYGYEITGLDVLNAYSFTMKAAENAGLAEQTLERIRSLVAKETFGERFVTRVLGRQLGLSQ